MRSDTPVVLLVGHHLLLLDFRALILAKFFKVVICQEKEDASLHIRDGGIHLLVLCHTLTDTEQRFLVGTAKCRSPNTKVIIIDDGESRNEPLQADARVSGLEGPKALISEIIQLLRLCQGDLRSSLFVAVRN